MVLFDSPNTGRSALPDRGKQRAMKSGLGLPVAFFSAPVIT